MWSFLKRFFTAAYDNTVGAIVVCVQHARQAAVDKKDHNTLTRLVTYLGYALFAIFFPGAVMFLALFRMLSVIDIIGTIGSILKDTANSYA